MGKDEKMSYKHLMEELPNNNKNSAPPRKNRGFQYKYADISCQYCKDKKDCRYRVCPHIMENLDDLMHDSGFISAIHNAETCKTKHRQALLTLREKLRGVS